MIPGASDTAPADFLAARVHGLMAHSVHGEILDTLSRSENADGYFRLLQAYGIAPSEHDVFGQSLREREYKVLDSLARRLGEKEATYYRAFLMRIPIVNLRLLLHVYLHPESASEVRRSLLPVPGYDTSWIESVLANPGSLGVQSSIPLPREIKRVFCEAVRRLDGSHDITLGAGVLDCFCYSALLAAAQQMGDVHGAAAEKLVRMEIDITNICMLLRAVKTYHFAPARLAELWLQGGLSVSKRLLTALSTEEDVKAVIQCLPGTYRSALQPIAGGELYVMETRLWKLFYRQVYRAFRSSESPLMPVIAFPYLKHFETMNLGRIYEGIHFGTPSQDMLDMMIRE